MLASFSSAFDPSETSDSSLDPLGLYAFSDALATRLIPGLRERMSIPRFLTTIAFGAHVCEPFRGRVAKDGRSDPYQIYEWLMVTGWYKNHRNTKELLGLPGVQKAEEAFNQSKPLNAARYLKTASVFGFHGVYRTLAEDIGVVDEAYQLGAAAKLEHRDAIDLLFALIVDAQRPHKQGLPVGSEHEERLFFETRFASRIPPAPLTGPLAPEPLPVRPPAARARVTALLLLS